MTQKTIKVSELVEFLAQEKFYTNIAKAKGQLVTHSWLSPKGDNKLRLQVRQNDQEGFKKGRGQNFDFHFDLPPDFELSVRAEDYKKITGQHKEKTTHNFKSRDNHLGKKHLNRVIRGKHTCR